MAKIFDINIKKATCTPTEIASNIWYLQEIISLYGQVKAGKIFYYFHCMYHLDSETNPFADLPKDKRSETIIRACFPEVDIEIDFDLPVMLAALDLVKELYETRPYRLYEAINSTMDKLTDAITFTPITLTKSEGNIGEMNKALISYDTMKIKAAEAKKAYIEDNETIEYKGGRTDTGFSKSNKILS